MKLSLKKLDYSLLQQCMHCGLCLPSCPTYAVTRLEKHSPRGRISLMKAVAEDRLPVSSSFGKEMYYCLGCLACESACPAGVDYTQLFEAARADVEATNSIRSPQRKLTRLLTLRILFRHPRLLRFVGRILGIYQQSGLETFVRKSGVLRMLPERLRSLEKQSPRIDPRFTHQRVAPIEAVPNRRFRVGLLSGCFQDLAYASVNQDTATVLLRNGCEVHCPKTQYCCGSLHAHNGEEEAARKLARMNLDHFPWREMDALISNSAGCGSHLKHYDRLLADDPLYAEAARQWSRKVRDVQEWLIEIGLTPPLAPDSAVAEKVPLKVTYHEACHLCHGQKITHQPRQLLRSIPGLELIELGESTWCCGSAGIYNLTHPDTAALLLKRKIGHVLATGALTVATANPGCLLQLTNGLKEVAPNLRVAHPVTLLAEAYAREAREQGTSDFSAEKGEI